MAIIRNLHIKNHPIFQSDGLENLSLRIIEPLVALPESQSMQW